MLDENRLQSDVGSGVLQIINASLHTVFLVLVVVFAALRGLPNLVVFSAIAFGAILVYFTISSITSFCGTLRAINVMLRIERALYAVSVVALATAALFLWSKLFLWYFAGLVWGIGLTAVLIAVLTGRGGEKWFRLMVIGIFLLTMINLSFSHINQSWLLLISFFIYILSNFMHTKFYIFWKRAFPFSLEMLGGIAFFMAVFLAVFA